MADETPEPEAVLRTKNRRLRSFHAMYAKLPKYVREIAVEKYRLFTMDPKHPSLNCHILKKTARGQHRTGTRAVCVNRNHRALFYIDGQVNVWYWIGTHADYDLFTGVK